MLTYEFLKHRSERNVFEAAANGSSIAGKTVMTVVVNYISFMSMLAFLDAGLGWFGDRVGYSEISFEVLRFKIQIRNRHATVIEIVQGNNIGRIASYQIYRHYT